MRERLIWRPNSFTLNEWQQLTRAEQILWWKQQEPPPKPVDWRITIQHYSNGLITDDNLPTWVLEILSEENAQEFLAACPAEMLDLVRKNAAELPADHDDESWGKLISIFGGCYASWLTIEEIQQSQRESERRFRAGVEVFRRFDQK